MLSAVRRVASRCRFALAVLALSMVVSSVPKPLAAADDRRQFASPADQDRQTKGKSDNARPSSAGVQPRNLRHVPALGFNGQGYAGEVEPNGTAATATPIIGTNVVVRANLFPN